MILYTTINGRCRSVTFVRDLPDLGEGPMCKVQDQDGKQHIVRKDDLKEVEYEEELQGFKISPRRDLRPGHLFRPIAGSGPRHNGECVGRSGRFVCRKIYRKGDKTYVLAMSKETGGLYDLYIEGPEYTSPAGSTIRPYKLKILT